MAQEVALEGGSVELRNCFDVDRTDDGISPRRLPAWTRAQIPDVFCDAMVRMSSGVRLAFVTDSPWLELEVMPTSFRTDGDPRRVHGFDLVIDGGAARTQETEGGNCFVIDFSTRAVTGFEPGEVLTLRWDDVAPNDGQQHEVEIWLPVAASVELRGLRAADGARVEAPPAHGRRRWVHYGSSISHCMEVVAPTQTWPATAARLGAVELTSLALAGQCHLDAFVARTIGDLAPDLISVKAGINVVNADSMRERAFVPALHGFIDTVRERCPSTPFLLVSPIVCPIAEDHPGPTPPTADRKFGVLDAPEEVRVGCLTLRRIRKLIEAAVAGRRGAGDEHLHYLDGLELFGAADAVDLPDDLHPNPAGYARIAERFAAFAFAPGGPFG